MNKLQKVMNKVKPLMLKVKDNVDLKELDNITLNDFINYVKKVRNDEITNVAPLGFSGDDFIVFENKNKPLRKEFISEEEYEKLEETGYFGKERYDKPVLRSCELSFRKYGKSEDFWALVNSLGGFKKVMYVDEDD